MNRSLSLGLRIAAGVALVLLASAVGVDSVLAGKSPEVALGAWPMSAEARANLSARLLSENPVSPDIARVRELATGALAREPLESTAAVSLAIAAITAGQREEGTRAYRFAERLSRRNTGAQMLLIEESVADHDIAGALVHYDRALRVSPRAGDVLFPVLVNASTNRPVADALGPLLRARPPWFNDFYYRLVQDGAPDAIYQVTRLAKLDPRIEAERVRFSAGLQRLTQAGRFDEAYALFREARPAAANEPLISDGSFEKGPELTPFDWWFADDADLAAVREPREGAEGRFALSLVRDSGRSTQVATQVLQLAPGVYRISGKAGAISGDEGSRPRIELRCANAGNALVAQIRLPEAPSEGAPFSGNAQIPAGCDFVWFSILPYSGVDQQTNVPWVDDLAIVRGQ